MRATTTIIPQVPEKTFYHIWDEMKAEVLYNEKEIRRYFDSYIEMLPRLAMGEYYWQIFDNAKPIPRIIAVGGAVDKLTPYSPEEFLTLAPETVVNLVHPEDRPHLMAFVLKAFSVLFSLPKEKRAECGISIFVRIKDASGGYTWSVLQYPAMFFDEQGDFLYGMALYSNINHLVKPGQQPMLTLLDTTNREQQKFTCYQQHSENAIELFLPSITNRQKQIINLLAQGKPSKEIADILKISKNTVDNHRQRLLKKFKVSSSAELVARSTGLY